MRTGRASATVLLLLGVAVVSVGVYSAKQAIAFLPSLNVADPPLAAAATTSSAPTRRLTERVVLIIVDGLRLDASRTMSSLARLRVAGIDAEASSHYPSMSRPNYVSIISGVPPLWSGVRNNDYAQAVPLDSMLERAQIAKLGVTFVSQVASGPRVMFGAHVDRTPIIPRESELESAVVTSLAGEDDLVAILVGAVDIAGHAHGADSPEYTDAVARVDAMLDRVLRQVDLARQTVLVVADHGHIDTGGHGGVEPEVMEVPLILTGAGIRPGAPLVRAQLIDVAPTVCALLGLPMPRHAMGLALVDALTLDLDERDELRRADITRIRAISAATVAARLEAEREAWSTRITRGGTSLLVLAAIIILTSWAARRRLVMIDLRVLLVALPAFPLTFYVMALTLEHMLTPSMVPAAGSLAPQLFRYGLVAAVVHAAVGWIVVAHRSQPADRVSAAAGLVLVGMSVALIPAALMWVMTGPPFGSRLPGPDVLMLPPTTYAALSCYCLGSLAFVALEYVAFLRRKQHVVKGA